jgi:hypothetical protein
MFSQALVRGVMFSLNEIDRLKDKKKKSKQHTHPYTLEAFKKVGGTLP